MTEPDPRGPNPPPAGISNSSPPTTPHVSGMATAAMVLGIIGLATSCVLIGIPLALAGLILGVISLSQIKKRPGILGGEGRARTGITLGICTLVGLPIVAVLFMPSLGQPRFGPRAPCAANITGMLKACVVYAQDNGDMFPMTPYTGTGYHVYYGTADTGTSNVNDALNRLQSSPNSQGNPASCLWILAIQGSISTKSLICPDDPFILRSPSPLQTAGGNFYFAPTSQNQLSYSIAAPWVTDPATSSTVVSPAWRNHTNASIPLMSDMAPINGTGGRNFVIANANNPKALNSNNHHGGDGQEVGFGDCHVEWCRTPAVGPNDDFIFTHNRTMPGTTWSGVQSIGTAPLAPADPLNDVQLIPARNLDDHSVR